MGQPEPKIETAHAILLLNGKYVLQLRDDRPDIAAPGKWGLFGGVIEPGETPAEAITRELREELSIRVEDARFLWRSEYRDAFVGGLVRTWFFASAVDSVWASHRLMEGRAAREFLFGELKDLNIPEVMVRALRRYHSGYREKYER